MNSSFLLWVLMSLGPLITDLPDSYSRSMKDLYASASDLETSLNRLPMWRSDRSLANEEWDTLFEVASELQKADPLAVELALRAHFIKTRDGVRDVADPNSRYMLLFRVMFELEKEPTVILRGGWQSAPAGKSWDEQPLWPVEWVDGKPRVVSRFAGYQGQTILPDSEYRHYFVNTKFRRLK